MALKATDFARTTKRISVEFDGETFDAWYAAHAVTPRAIQRIEERGDSITTLVDVLAVFVTEWDIIDEHGQRVPPTRDVMLDYPAQLLNAVLTAITADMTPGEPTAGGSLVG